MQAIQRDFGAQGLVLVGVTREFQRRGVLPAVAAQGGRPALAKELYEGETREAYLAHLEAFRARTEVTYPFLLVEGSDFGGYPVRGFPTLVLIDPDGTIGFVTEGGMKDGLIRVGIRRRLEADAR